MKQSTNSLVVVVVLAVAVVVAAVVYTWFFVEVRQKVEAYSLLLKEVAFEEGRGERLESVERLIRDVAEERDLLEAQFVTQDDVVSFIDDIETVGASSGTSVTISNIRIDEDDQGRLLSMDVSFGGSWQQVVRFVAAVEQFPKAIEVPRLLLEFQGESDDATGWQGSLGLQVLMSSEAQTP